ncbi:hypothetical protein AAFC00_004987 [Neodothiora populina]|uniref:SET domain-containing protein n=1 Tax=Neodothiora populina TaxID=2781224 RepID=A0ABR3P410_9PEZI
MILQGKTEGWLRSPVDALPVWAAFNGVSFNNIKIAPIPGLEDRGSTVVAQRQLTGGSEPPLMVVPQDLILSLERIREHAKADGDFRAVLEGLEDFGRTARGAILSFLLMQSFTVCSSMEPRRGVSTPFAEYVKFLPLELLPTFWNDSERDLLRGTTLAPAINAKLNSLYREFDRLRAATAGIPWCVESWWNEVDGLLSFDDWLQVDAMYRSRALEFPGVGDCMVPGIDMSNHASGEKTGAIYEVDDQGNALLLLREGTTISADSEITITYGDNKGACEMLFSYGFIEDDMHTARELFLSLSIPEDDPLGHAKTIVADCPPGFKIVDTEDGIAWEGDYVWLLCVNEEDGLCFKVQQTVQGERELVATWKNEEIDSFANLKAILEEDDMWNLFRLRATVILQERIATQLTELYGCEDRVNQVDHGEETEVRTRVWQLTMKLRDLEGQLMEKAYSYFEDVKNELAQSKTVAEYLATVSSSANQVEEGIEDFS